LKVLQTAATSGVVLGRVHYERGLSVLPVAIRQDMIENAESRRVIRQRTAHPLDKVAQLIAGAGIVAWFFGHSVSFVLYQRLAAGFVAPLAGNAPHDLRKKKQEEERRLAKGGDQRAPCRGPH
jgi:hypothetical protein